MTDPSTVLAAVETWGAAHAAASVVGPSGIIASHGDPDHVYAWASVTKLLTAVVVLLEVDAGRIGLDDAAGPPGATVRHLLAHASGLPFEGRTAVSPPERTRMYSNGGFDILGELAAERAGLAFSDLFADRLLVPLRMTGTEVRERASQGGWGPLADLERFARELLRPTILDPATLTLATSVAFPGLVGVLPGVGRYPTLDWGLGFELRDAKEPHWTGTTNSPATYGHFGGAGTFLWIDPVADMGLVCLTDREFGGWALDAWPALSDAVLAAHR